MKNCVCLIAGVFFCVILTGGCIPSAPSTEGEPSASAAEQPVPAQPAEPAVEKQVQAEAPVPEAPPTVAPEANNAAASPENESAPDEKSSLQVSLDADQIPEGAIPLPVVSFVPIEGAKGYRLQSRFPVEGLSMEGTVMLTGPGKWLLSGQFKSNTDAFVPGQPTAQALGATEKGEDGVLKFTSTDHGMMIFFPAPMPPADAPKLEQPKTIPFNFTFDAPDDAVFNIMLTPF